jgi:hypothetical protein
MTRLQHALQHAGDPPVVTAGTSDHGVRAALTKCATETAAG